MLTALVMMVRLLKFRNARAIEVVVVPESRISTWPSFNFLGRCFGDAQLLLVVKLFFLPERWIFQRSFARGKSASVSSVHQAVRVQNLQIFPDRNLGGFELPGEFRH